MSSKIDHQLFSAHEHALEHEACPQCDGELQLRHGKHGPFMGCTIILNATILSRCIRMMGISSKNLVCLAQSAKMNWY